MEHIVINIIWDTEPETWTSPFTAEQVANLRANHASVDGLISVVGIGPDRPDLILAVGAHDADHYAGEPGSEWQVRFGRMRIEDFETLPEHGGW